VWTKFKVPKVYAIFLFGLYAVYNVMVLLALFNVLESWGIVNDHELNA